MGHGFQSWLNTENWILKTENLSTWSEAPDAPWCRHQGSDRVELERHEALGLGGIGSGYRVSEASREEEPLTITVLAAPEHHRDRFHHGAVGEVGDHVSADSAIDHPESSEPVHSQFQTGKPSASETARSVTIDPQPW